MSISLIVAMAENRVIGRGGGLPWHLSADLKRFRRLTTGHVIIMGRKTYDSIGRPLPLRRSIVISRDSNYQPDGVEVVGSLDEAIQAVAGDDEAFIIGGASIYEAALPVVNRLYVTRVHAEVEGDVFFPKIDWNGWRLAQESNTETDEKSGLRFSFQTYEKR